jgi:hypothetical protein
MCPIGFSYAQYRGPGIQGLTSRGKGTHVRFLPSVGVGGDGPQKQHAAVVTYVCNTLRWAMPCPSTGWCAAEECSSPHQPAHSLDNISAIGVACCLTLFKWCAETAALTFICATISG